jgi:spore germination protein KC
MRKLSAVSILLVIAAALSGCVQIAQGRAEIDKLFIVRLISIDEAENGKVRLTLTTKSLSGGGGGQEQQQKAESITAEGSTIFDAAKSLFVYSDRKPSYGHTEYILFSEAIARKGILPYLDFISRNNEFRYNAKLYIVKGSSADNLAKNSNTSKMFIGDRLANIEDNAIHTSLSSQVTLNEALFILDDPTLATFIPYIEVVKTMTSEEQQGIYDFLLKGYAIFRHDKLSYFTSMEEARGINWIKNRIGSGIITVKCKNNEDVALEIVDARIKIKPRIEGNELHCAVEVTFTTNIAEITGTSSVLDYESIQFMEGEQNKAIKKEIESALELAQKHNSDRFGIRPYFYMKYPMLEQFFIDNWNQLFPEIKFEVKVQSNIKGTYLINDPTKSTLEAEGE